MFVHGCGRFTPFVNFGPTRGVIGQKTIGSYKKDISFLIAYNLSYL
jgi:hypothetical protein